jgi:hypothetical protein
MSSTQKNQALKSGTLPANLIFQLSYAELYVIAYKMNNNQPPPTYAAMRGKTELARFVARMVQSGVEKITNRTLPADAIHLNDLSQ